MRQIVLDTETTGLETAQGHRIIELGCVELVNRQPTGNNLHLYFNPERESDEGALAVHGLDSQFLSQYPVFAEQVERVVQYLQGAELIIHNAKFDMGFLDYEMQRLQRPPLSDMVSNVIDTVALARGLYPGKRVSLDSLCARLGIDNSHRTLHGALLDAQLLADVYIAMTRGQFGLALGDIADTPQTQVDAVPATAGNQLWALPVLMASADEQLAHRQYIHDLATAAGIDPW